MKEDTGDILKTVSDRWLLDNESAKILSEKLSSEPIHLLGISLGLGELFNDDAAAEAIWIQVYHPILKRSPLACLLEDGLAGARAVLAELDEARNLR